MVTLLFYLWSVRDAPRGNFRLVYITQDTVTFLVALTYERTRRDAYQYIFHHPSYIPEIAAFSALTCHLTNHLRCIPSDYDAWMVSGSFLGIFAYAINASY